MLKYVGMAVPKTRETRAVYMPQDKRLWHTTIIPCVAPPYNTMCNPSLYMSFNIGLRMVLLLYAIIFCLMAYILPGFWHCHSYIGSFSIINEKFLHFSYMPSSYVLRHIFPILFDTLMPTCSCFYIIKTL